MPPKSAFTITVTVDTTTTPPTLAYAGAGTGGSTTSRARHKIFRNCALTFTSPDGDLLIQFKGDKKPFKSKGADVLVTATRGNPTPVLTTRTKAWGPRVKYTAAVAVAAGGPPFLLSEDPELEDGAGPGGGPKRPTKKKAGKKKAKKK